MIAPAKKSSEDFLQVDPKIIFKSRASTSDVHSSNGFLSNVSSKSEHDSGWSTCGTSMDSGPTHESPRTQKMERPTDFSPNRIPSSIFASDPPTPTDWSGTSEESLFSIPIGRNSFARDHVHMLSGELCKSRKSPKSSDLKEFGGSNKSSELFGFSPPPPAVQLKKSDRKNVNMERNFGETGLAAGETIKDARMETIKEHSKERLPIKEISFNQRSNDSEIICTQPSASKEKKKHVESWCHCFNCNCGFCCSKWTICSFCRLSSCTCCRWLKCCFCKVPSCNCSSWLSCCCKWPRCNCSIWRSCSCCKWPSCNCSIWPSCSCCKWPSCNCSRWPSCSCCKWPSCNCSIWPSCSHCKWPSCNCSIWPSCSCCKWPSCNCSTWLNCCCCKWPSCNCCKWPSCSWCAFGCCWNFILKRIFCCS